MECVVARVWASVARVAGAVARVDPALARVARSVARVDPALARVAHLVARVACSVARVTHPVARLAFIYSIMLSLTAMVPVPMVPLSPWSPPCYALIWPLPRMIYFVEVSAGSPIGPRACSFCVLMPISAPKPNSKPSVNLVEAL